MDGWDERRQGTGGEGRRWGQQKKGAGGKMQLNKKKNKEK
jgi:hypothetical protein